MNGVPQRMQRLDVREGVACMSGVPSKPGDCFDGDTVSRSILLVKFRTAVIFIPFWIVAVIMFATTIFMGVPQ